MKKLSLLFELIFVTVLLVGCRENAQDASTRPLGEASVAAATEQPQPAAVILPTSTPTPSVDPTISQLAGRYRFHPVVVVSDFGQLYDPAGYPALAVPSGYAADGTPQKVVFVGGFLSEPQLLAVGFAYEQASQARVAPDLEATMRLIEAIDND